MFERCPVQPLHPAEMPANQGIQPYTFVPSYTMTVGHGSYQTGYSWFPTMMQIDKPVYTAKDVPFQKLSTNYQP